MRNSHTNNSKRKRLLERCLRIIYNDQQSSFSELLEKENSVSIHMRNIQSVATEKLCVSRNITAPMTNDILPLQAL